MEDHNNRATTTRTMPRAKTLLLLLVNRLIITIAD